MVRSMIKAAVLAAGEYYPALDENDELVGRDLFDTPEQRELGLNEFMARLPDAGKQYYKAVYLKEFPVFVNECMGSAKATEKGQTLACSTTQDYNALVYKSYGFEQKGERTMPSPWGDWPLYVFALDTKRA
ncbi:uncharacterized protein B0H18DRAFT_986392 [Fomitopsis serialis]|uniref:uncharacterized protein n=1 Tax=Fomitopsis serialis TaxID=139415 RepID=UPI002008C343|nr:uncharacterized protein B0H18DRAFT_986392 [Neoantrodia serialis]KAH9932591.1 hypothetical protein B0H18DRAFT_986392 [Neoantrodia serialis]